MEMASGGPARMLGGTNLKTWIGKLFEERERKDTS